MSHNVTALVPYITEHTTALSTAGAGQSLVIQGFGLGLDARVEIPAALGVETARTFTKTGPTEGVLTITLTVESYTQGTTTDRTVAISMGGVPCQGPYVTSGMVTVKHGWSPLLLNPALWFDANDNTTFGYSSGEIISWADKSSNAVVLEQADASRRAVRAVKTEFTGGTASGHVFAAEDTKHLDFTGSAPTIVDGSNQFTHFIVLSLHDQDANLIRLGSGQHGAVWKLDGKGGSPIHHGTTANSTGGERTSVPTSSYLGDNVAHMVTVIGDASAGYSTRLNGAVVDSPDGATLQAVQPAASHAGNSGGTLGNLGNAYFAEIIHVPRLCTASEIETVEAYLDNKWGVYP